MLLATALGSSTFCLDPFLLRTTIINMLTESNVTANDIPTALITTVRLCLPSHRKQQKQCTLTHILAFH